MEEDTESHLRALVYLVRNYLVEANMTQVRHHVLMIQMTTTLLGLNLWAKESVNNQMTIQCIKIKAVATVHEWSGTLRAYVRGG